jgi:hypothetical protein
MKNFKNFSYDSIAKVYQQTFLSENKANEPFVIDSNTTLETLEKEFAFTKADDYFIKRKFLKINNPIDEKVQLALVRKDPNLILYIDKPTEKVQLAAVRRDGHTLEYILKKQKPSEKVIIAAIKQNGSVIKYIKNPSEKLQFVAIEEDHASIHYIDKPTENVQLAVINKSPHAIKWIKNPSRQARELSAMLISKIRR